MNEQTDVRDRGTDLTIRVRLERIENVIDETTTAFAKGLMPHFQGILIERITITAMLEVPSWKYTVHMRIGAMLHPLC